MKTNLKILVIILFAGWLTACNHAPKVTGRPLRIAISKMHKKRTYSNWLHRYDTTLLLYNMYPLGIDSAMKLANRVDGILITGGEDVYPGYYGKEGDTSRCGTFNRYRDSLEMALINYALDNKVPLIGICRGEQIINVALGGSLIIDIPTDWDTVVKHADKNWNLQWHNVSIVPGTKMASISRVKQGRVSSSHHQAIDRLGKGLVISAFAPDSIPEAIEWSSGANKGFLMATQWHPEHMDTLSPLSAPFAKIFLKEASLYRSTKK
jgi:putative glutamine amidotransferase